MKAVDETHRKNIDRRGLNSGRRRSLENLRPWKPGQSGNPAGRPKGVRYLSEALRDLVENGVLPKDASRALLDALAWSLIDSALAGDVAAWKELANRVDGPVAAMIEGPDGSAFGAPSPEALAAALARAEEIRKKRAAK